MNKRSKQKIERKEKNLKPLVKSYDSDIESAEYVINKKSQRDRERERRGIKRIASNELFLKFI